MVYNSGPGQLVVGRLWCYLFLVFLFLVLFLFLLWYYLGFALQHTVRETIKQLLRWRMDDGCVREWLILIGTVAVVVGSCRGQARHA